MTRILIFVAALGVSCSFDLRRSSPGDGVRGDAVGAGDSRPDAPGASDALIDLGPDSAFKRDALVPGCTGKCVTTLAGRDPGYANGKGSAAMFQGPSGIAFAGSTLYVADTDNHRIRTVSLIDGSVSTLAGTGANAAGMFTNGPATLATFCFPQDIAFDPQGAVLVADTGDNVLRRILNGNVSSPLQESLRPLAILIAGSKLYFSAELNTQAAKAAHQVFSNTPSLAGTSTLVAGLGPAGYLDEISSKAQFNFITGLAADGDVLYLADSKNHRVRKIDAGAVSTLTPLGQFTTPYGIVFDSGGNRLLVSDLDDHCIRQIDLALKNVGVLAGGCGQSGDADGTPSQARFKSPRGMALGVGVLYIADTGNHRIRVLAL